jgi:hypothetical protein
MPASVVSMPAVSPDRWKDYSLFEIDHTPLSIVVKPSSALAAEYSLGSGGRFAGVAKIGCLCVGTTPAQMEPCPLNCFRTFLLDGGVMETSAEIGLRSSVTRTLGDRGVAGFVRIASDLADEPQNGDKGEKFAGNNVHSSVRKILAHQRSYSEQFATLLAENNCSSFPKETKLRPFTVRSPGRLSVDDSRHFSTLVGAALGLVLMVSAGISLWYATLGVMPRESPSNSIMAVAGNEAEPTSSLAQSRRTPADEKEENAQAAIQLAPMATAVLSSIESSSTESPVQQVLQSSGRLQAAIDAAPSRPSEIAILIAALPSDASAHSVGEFGSAPNSQLGHEQGNPNSAFILPEPAASTSNSVPTVRQSANPSPQTHPTASNEPSRTTTSAKTSKADHDKREATYIADYAKKAVDTPARITTASATVAGPSVIADTKDQKADSLAGIDSDESSGSRKPRSGSNDVEPTDKKDKHVRSGQGGASTPGGDTSKAGPHGSNSSEGGGKSSASSDSGSSKGNSPKGHPDKDKKGGKGNGGKGNSGNGNGKGAD